MTMTCASSAVRGRRVKFTPQAMEKIKEFVAEGISRDEIANRLGVSVGPLQVTCSRLCITLRRIISANGSGRHTADVRLGSVGVAHVQEQKEVSQPAARAAPLPKFAITLRHRGKEQTTDILLSSPPIEVLAREAASRDLSIAALIGQHLVAVIDRDTIRKFLREAGSPSSTSRRLLLFLLTIATPRYGRSSSSPVRFFHPQFSAAFGSRTASSASASIRPRQMLSADVTRGVSLAPPRRASAHD